MHEQQYNPTAEKPAGQRHRASALLRLWAGFQSALFAVVPAVILLLLMALVVREIHQDTIEVAPIQVPARLAETGLTSEVVARSAYWIKLRRRNGL